MLRIFKPNAIGVLVEKGMCGFLLNPSTPSSKEITAALVENATEISHGKGLYGLLSDPHRPYVRAILPTFRAKRDWDLRMRGAMWLTTAST